MKWLFDNALIFRTHPLFADFLFIYLFITNTMAFVIKYPYFPSDLHFTSQVFSSS